MENIVASINPSIHGVNVTTWNCHSWSHNFVFEVVDHEDDEDKDAEKTISKIPENVPTQFDHRRNLLCIVLVLTSCEVSFILKEKGQYNRFSAVSVIDMFIKRKCKKNARWHCAARKGLCA